MEDTIREWKSIWGPIWSVTIGGTEYIYRLLRISEHRIIHSASLNDCEFEDAVVREALLYPPIGDPLAMVPTILAGHILGSSMLGSDSDAWSVYLERRKGELMPRKVDGQVGDVIDDPIIPLVVRICQAFPAYRPDELLELPVADLLDRLAWAELALGNIGKGAVKTQNMPGGLSGGDRQQYLEEASASLSKDALKEAMNART